MLSVIAVSCMGAVWFLRYSVEGRLLATSKLPMQLKL